MTVTLKFGWCDCVNNVNVYSNEITQTIDFDCTKKLTELVQTTLKYTDPDEKSKSIACYLYVCRAASGHKGGNATCIAPAKCSLCSLETDPVNADKHAGTVDKNGFYSCCSKPNTPENVNGVYQISNIGHLVWFRDYVNQGNTSANAILLNDLDMTDVAWTPIASTALYYNENPTEESEWGYKGTFDGNGKVIKNLTMTGSSEKDASFGLFGTLSGTVKNLGIENFKYTGAEKDSHVGSVAGQMLSGALIENCFANTGNINTKVGTDTGVAGGIAGCNYGGTICGCLQVNYTISAGRHAGIVSDNCGDSSSSDRKGTVVNCVTNYGSVENKDRKGKVTNSQSGLDNTRLASGEAAWVLNGNSADGAWGQTLGTDNYPVLGGAEVYQIINCKNETIYSNTNENIGHIWEDGICTVCKLTKDSDGNYLIGTADDLVAFSGVVNSGETSANAILTADIDMSGKSWTPIGNESTRYAGTFDGNYHVIYNLSVKVDTVHETGLFGRITSGTVKNLGVINATVENTKNIRAGVIAGEIHKSTVENVFTAGTITVTTTNSQAGGIAGECASSTLTNCYTTYGCLAYQGTANNCYYQAESANTSSTGTNLPASAFTGGEVAYLLQGDRTEQVWGQNIDGEGTKDAYPVFSDDKVYQVSDPAGYTNTAPEATTYTVTVNEAENGTVIGGGSYAVDATVTLTITPNEGYKLGTLTVKCGETEIEVDEDYTFTMPAGDVTVTAAFEECSIDVGDVNSDGAITIADVLIILQSVLNGSEISNADMNSDGELSLIDVLRVLKLCVN